MAAVAAESRSSKEIDIREAWGEEHPLESTPMSRELHKPSLARSIVTDETDVESTEYDEKQDDRIQEIIDTNRKLLNYLHQTGQTPDLTPPSWKDVSEPIPWTDRAIYPPYVYGNHLVAWKNGSYQCICHDTPPTPFNPFWGIEGHESEAVGINKYDPEDHNRHLVGFGELTQAQRVGRAMEVAKEMHE